MSAVDQNTSPGALTARYKQQAAERAVDYIRPGMVVGLGTGSTAIYATRHLAALLRAGALTDITAYATSNAVRREAEALGLSLMAEEMPHDIDVTIDGADEVDPRMNLIKGGGGALLREKIVAQASRRVVIVVDDRKLVDRLGSTHALPVEVIAFGWRSQARFLESLGARVVIRHSANGSPFLTDSGHIIFDCDFGPIADPEALAERLSIRAGIVEHGLFLKMATDLVVAGAEGVKVRSLAGG